MSIEPVLRLRGFSHQVRFRDQRLCQFRQPWRHILNVHRIRMVCVVVTHGPIRVAVVAGECPLELVIPAPSDDDGRCTKRFQSVSDALNLAFHHSEVQVITSQDLVAWPSDTDAAQRPQDGDAIKTSASDNSCQKSKAD